MGVKPIRRRTYRLETPPARPVAAPGRPLPLGASRRGDRVNFALVCPGDAEVALVLYRARTMLELRLDPARHRTGDVWHVELQGVEEPAVEYGWRVRRPGAAGDTVLLDPYARTINGGERWERVEPGPGDAARGGTVRPRRSCFVEDDFDWRGDTPPRRHPADMVIYELHVRGFTRHGSSGVEHPGTYRGVIEKIPYLRDLGVTAVELMPVTEFEENRNPRTDPTTGRRLLNFWGYDPLGFFAVKAGYAASPGPAERLREFKEMVRELHAAGIEVILDMVLNHTAEGDENGPTLSFRGIDPATYYLLDPATGEYLDYSGCGNTVHCNHPIVRDLILDALRTWVVETHVDGFRFDLASVLTRGSDGVGLADPPLVERIAGDPVLAGVKLIAEPWDAVGLYQVGSFPHHGRWTEWNGRFRDDVRRFVRGDAGTVPRLATRLAGSSDLYRDDGRRPFHGVNFVTCHDGFPLADVVRYARRHNESNGQRNTDGHAAEISWNHGVEGPSSSPEIEELRRRQMKNLLALLLLSQGVPMLSAGDELGRTQRGNNNAWCHDDELSWMDWDLRHGSGADLFRFVRGLLRFRREHPLLRRREFFDEASDEVYWHGRRPGRPEWTDEARLLGMQLVDRRRGDEICLYASSDARGVVVELPGCRATARWTRFVDTRLAPPDELVEGPRRPGLVDPGTYPVGPHSVVILVGEPRAAV